jgi:hypothetical protein
VEVKQTNSWVSCSFGFRIGLIYNEKINRINMIRKLWKMVKLIVAMIIGLTWDLKYADYVSSWLFKADLNSFFINFFSQSMADRVADIFFEVVPLFCIVCFFHPIHCYLRGAGWYCQSTGDFNRAFKK